MSELMSGPDNSENPLLEALRESVARAKARRRLNHPWIGILGHPDDDECSECGEPEHRHTETSR